MITVPYVVLRMTERKKHFGFRWCDSSIWTLVVTLFMLPHYSESQTCHVLNCVSTECNSQTCNRCIDGYYLHLNGSCVQCQQVLPNCVTCSNSSFCDACNDGYYLQSGNCYKCNERCSLCPISTQCTKCKDKYWNLPSYCALPCSTNCTDSGCDDTTGYCYDCKPGTYGSHCGEDCNLCRDGQCDLRKCTHGCKDGYFQDNTANGHSYCSKCVYDNCIACSNGTYCTQCEQGYYRNYYRIQYSGRGAINCLQCYESCLDCSSTEHCHEDCIQQCRNPVNPETTKSTYNTATTTSTTLKTSSSSNAPRTSTHEFSESAKSTESTPIDACQFCNEVFYKELISCRQQVKTSRVGEDQYQLTFGHGIAIGICITMVVFGCVVGIALFLRRKTNLHKNCLGLADEHSNEGHEYANTTMTDIVSVTSPDHIEVHNDIHAASRPSTNSNVINQYQNIESSREYVSLGERSAQESDYTDLQNT